MTIMKDKFMILLAALTLMMAFTACGEKGEDDPDWKKKDVVFTTELMNHVYDASADKVYELTTTTNKLVFHRVNNTADLTLVPGEAAFPGLTLQLAGLKLELDGDTGRYGYKSATTSNNRVTNLVLNVDFNEQSLDVHYVVDGKVTVTSQMPQVFYLANQSILSYKNGTDSIDKSSIYQFDIDTKSMTATMHLGPLANTKLLLKFETIIARNMPITVTKEGITIECEKPTVVSEYRRRDSSTGSPTVVDALDNSGYQKFPIADFRAKLMFMEGKHETSFMIGRDDEGTKWSVKGTGQTYIEKAF